MTQAAEASINWGLALGSIAGCGVVLGGLVVVYKVKEWRREKRRERPPQPEKILRPAGYYLQQRVNELWDDLMFALIQTLGAGFLAGLTIALVFPVLTGLAMRRFTFAQILSVPKGYLIYCALGFGIGAALWTVRGFLVFSKLYDEIRKCRFGLRGEQAVAEKLMGRELAAAGYTTFHDLPCERERVKWNVDHVVVGPGGVFAIETKARWKRRGTGDAAANKAVFDGETLTLGGWRDCQVVGQVRRNAEWVRELVKEFAPEGILVQPVIAVPGWYVESLGNYAVKAMPATYLVRYLRGAKPVYTAKDLRGVVKKLDEVCRDLEF